MMMIILSTCLLLVATITDAQCLCTASGDPHYTMCDGKTKYDYQGVGLHRMFKIDDLEVQCANKKMTKDAVVAYIDYCRIKLTKGSCDLVIQTPDQDNGQLQINGQTFSDASKYNMDAAFTGTTISSKGKLITLDCQTSQGHVTIVAGPSSFSIIAKDANKCTGMCGTCSGKETKPKDLIANGKTCASAPAILTGNTCGASNATAAPTTTPIPSLGPGPVYAPPNNTYVPLHPVFQSEQVMKSCVKACMCGEKDQRMKDDEVFASFVENCIYDKALGPGSEKIAVSNMEIYITVSKLTAALPMSENWANSTVYTIPSANFSAILDPVVTKKPSEIAVGDGCTYELKYTKTATGPKADYLRMRDSRSMGAAAEEDSFTSTEQDSSMSETFEFGEGTATVAQKMRIHLDLEAPVVVVQASKKVVKKESESSSHTSSSGGKKGSQIRISSGSGSNPISSGSGSNPSDQAAIGATSAPIPAPTAVATPAPIRQYQVATIVRSRDVPASEIKSAPTPLPAMVFAQPAPQQVLQAVAAPVAAVPMMAAPVVQAAPIMQPAPFVAAPPAPMVMEARVSDEAKQAMAAQQQQQRDALKQQQDNQAKNLAAQQQAQMQQAQKPLKMMVQQNHPAMVFSAAQPSVMASPVAMQPMQMQQQVMMQPSIAGQQMMVGTPMAMVAAGAQASAQAGAQAGAQAAAQAGSAGFAQAGVQQYASGAPGSTGSNNTYTQ